MTSSLVVLSAASSGEDRGHVHETSSGVVAVVADGAGGVSGGAEAADAVISAVAGLRAGAVTLNARRLRFLLQATDQTIARSSQAGETTAVVVAIANGEVFGASVGDSEAWSVDEEHAAVLTAHQRRKPLLGSGEAAPVAFGPLPFQGRLLLGSDGLFKYVPRSELLRQARRSGEVDQVAHGLAESARLPSGTLQDDVSVIMLVANEPANENLHQTGRFAARR